MSEDDMDSAFAAVGTSVDAVLQYLNPLRTSDNPWAKFLGPPRLIADSTSNSARALLKQQRGSSTAMPRLVVTSAVGVGRSRQVAPWITKFLVDHSNVGKTYADHEAVNNEIEGNCKNQIRWILPLPVALGNAGIKPVKTFGETELGAGLFITRESCARWMVDAAAGKFGDAFDNKRMVMSN
jgi:hypothetical protein